MPLIKIALNKNTVEKQMNELAERLRNEGSNQTVTICHQLKMPADETTYLLSSMENKQHLMKSIAQAENGEVVEFS